MRKLPIKPPALRSTPLTRLLSLLGVTALILVSILLLRGIAPEEKEFDDALAHRLRQEMEDNRIVLSAGPGRRTAAEFREPILLSHGKESRLIVHTAHMSETICIASEGWGGWDWTSAYQDIVYEGDAQYTVDLSRLSGGDFTVNNELKTLTVRIPYAQLTPIHIPADQIKFHDVVKGWAAPRDIKLTAQENALLMIQVSDKMKAKLIDDNIIAAANESAKAVVAQLLCATVQAVDPEYTVVVVQ